MDRNVRNLDILRALAVLFVLAAHTATLISHTALADRIDGSLGRFGVLLFFVHTALVLLMSLERSAGNRLWPVRFYIQRAFRIYPLSVLCVAATLLFRIPVLPGFAFERPSISMILENLTLTQNLAHPRALPGTHRLFDGSLSGPMWSLPFELQMYLLLPAVFLIVRKHRSPGAWLLLEFAMILAVLEHFLIHHRIPLIEFFPCFLSGALAFSLIGRKPMRFSWILWPVTICALSGLFLYIPQVSLSEWATCIAVGLLIPMFREAPSGLASKAAEIVAKYSFGIYLSQLPLRWLLFVRFDLPHWLQWSLYPVSIAAVSWALYHALEAPMIRTGRRIAARIGEPSSRNESIRATAAAG